MWTLARMLPVMVGHYVSEDDEHWLHYIELLDIVDLIFSPTLHPNTPGYLEATIEEKLLHYMEQRVYYQRCIF